MVVSTTTSKFLETLEVWGGEANTGARGAQARLRVMTSFV